MGLITDENVHVAYVHVLCPKISSRHILPNYLIFIDILRFKQYSFVNTCIKKKSKIFPLKKSSRLLGFNTQLSISQRFCFEMP